MFCQLNRFNLIFLFLWICFLFLFCFNFFHFPVCVCCLVRCLFVKRERTHSPFSTLECIDFYIVLTLWAGWWLRARHRIDGKINSFRVFLCCKLNSPRKSADAAANGKVVQWTRNFDEILILMDALLKFHSVRIRNSPGSAWSERRKKRRIYSYFPSPWHRLRYRRCRSPFTTSMCGCVRLCVRVVCAMEENDQQQYAKKFMI